LYSQHYPLRTTTGSSWAVLLADATARVLRAFLKAEDDAGRRVDFHSLRVTFVTLLAAAGVPVKTIQTLARHSAPVLTMTTYARTLHGSESEAVARLPDFTRPTRTAARATGTDCAAPCPPTTGGPTGGKTARERASAFSTTHGTQARSGVVEENGNPRLQAENQEKRPASGMRGADGSGWIRTSVGKRQRVYSPSPLATRAHSQFHIVVLLPIGRSTIRVQDHVHGKGVAETRIVILEQIPAGGQPRFTASSNRKPSHNHTPHPHPLSRASEP